MPSPFPLLAGSGRRRMDRETLNTDPKNVRGMIKVRMVSVLSESS